MRIIQFFPALDYGDAVSNDIVQLHKYFMELGFDSRICCPFYHPDMKSWVTSPEECPGAPDDLLLFHFHYDNDFLDYAEKFPGKRVLVYHNITPAEYFKGINEEVYFHCLRGRQQLQGLAKLFSAGIGDSEFNRRELDKVGFKQTMVLPIAVDLDAISIHPHNPEYRQQFMDGKTNLLFVGRIVPNKKQDDLIRLLEVYRKTYNPDTRLILAGKYQPSDQYYQSLLALVEEKKLQDAVVFTGGITTEQMMSLYLSANVFVSMSEHEGFCVPVLESFIFKLPVLGYAAGAVPELMGKQGSLVKEKQWESVAAQLHRLLTDTTYRQMIVSHQVRQLKPFTKPRMKEKIRQAIEFCIGDKSRVKTKVPLKVSVVVCSVGRPELLKYTLDGLTRQSYPHMEVVVVHDPTDERTCKVLTSYPRLKTVGTRETNLSHSRNLGIALCDGDIIAFQDDDAVAHEDWVKDIVEGYSNPKVGAVGGLVYKGNDGTVVQFANGCITRYGQSMPFNARHEEHNDPNGFVFNYTMGTNSSFRKSVLLELGGFDEHIRFFGDDSDICLRLTEKGYRVHHHPRAIMFHHFAKGYIRQDDFDWRWDVIIHDNLYFALKHAKDNILFVIAKTCYRLLLRFWLLIFLRQPTPMTFRRLKNFILRAGKGIGWGYGVGLFSQPRLQPKETLSRGGGGFKPFNEHPVKVTVIDRPLRIALMSQDYPPVSYGGIATYTYLMGQEMAKQGHDVHVFTADYPRAKDGNVVMHPVGRNKELPFELSDKQYQVTRKNLAYGYGVYHKIMEVFGSNQPDIVETPIWDSEGLVYSQNKIAPLVLRLSSPLKKMVETHCWVPDQDLLLSMDLERELMRHSDGIIAISGSILNTITDKYSISFDSKPVMVSHLGVPVPEVKKEVQHSGSKIRVLFLGRLERRKGIHTVLDAIPKVFAATKNIEFVLVGKDSPDFTTGKYFGEYFKETWAKAPWFNNVHFKGEVDEASKWDYYAGCDIFISPSLYESFGLIFLEAMSYGKVAIGSRAGAIPEIIQPGDNGYLITPENVDELAEIIIKLAENPDLRAKIGKHARQTVLQDFSVEKSTRETIEFYRELMAMKPR